MNKNAHFRIEISYRVINTLWYDFLRLTTLPPFTDKLYDFYIQAHKKKMDAMKLIRLFSFCKIIANGGFVHAQSPLLRRDTKSIRTIDETILQLTDFDINLQELPCNVPFTTMTSQNITAQLTNIFLDKMNRTFIDDQDGKKIIKEFIPLIKHDVQLVRVSRGWIIHCASRNHV